MLQIEQKKVNLLKGIFLNLTEKEAPYREFSEKLSERRFEIGRVGESLAKKALEVKGLWVERNEDLISEAIIANVNIDCRADLAVFPTDWTPLKKKYLEDMTIIDWSQVCFVGVKGSLGKFPALARRHFSKTQWKDPLWDALVRVKVLTPMEGEVHRDDVDNVVLEVVEREQRAIHKVMMAEYAVGYALEMRRYRRRTRNIKAYRNLISFAKLPKDLSEKTGPTLAKTRSVAHKAILKHPKWVGMNF